MEYKIEIPDGYELVKTDDGYAVREKKEPEPPKSWLEFCERYPVSGSEIYIGGDSSLWRHFSPKRRDAFIDKNLIATEDEASAFLALMQLRQLRKAWVGDWTQEQAQDKKCPVIKHSIMVGLSVATTTDWTNVMTFPTMDMAHEFLECFKELLEKAKTLL